nr:immunoglobulin light chain junction region [Macaca mulatta]
LIITVPSTCGGIWLF